MYTIFSKTETISFDEVKSDNIKYLSVYEDGWTIKGAILPNGMFMPNSLIEKMYEKIYKADIKRNYCKEIPNTEKYEYYQWNGNPEDIKDVEFLKKLYDDGCFTIGAKDYEHYHLDLQYYCGEIVDIYPGDYIVNKNDNIEIVEKNEFEKKYFKK